jgi:hypothetical protein
MDVQLRAAGRMALVCFLALVVNAGKLAHAGFYPVLVAFAALILFAYFNPRQCFRDL